MSSAGSAASPESHLSITFWYAPERASSPSAPASAFDNPGCSLEIAIATLRSMYGSIWSSGSGTFSKAAPDSLAMARTETVKSIQASTVPLLIATIAPCAPG
ncbi:hypothetical protein GCM10018952_24150 [Streptosporangium vulgare]